MRKVLLLLSFHNVTHLLWLKLLLERGVNTESVKADYWVFFKLSLRQIFQGVYLPLRTPHRLKKWFSDRKGLQIWYDVFALSKKNNLSKTDIFFFFFKSSFCLPGSHLVPKNWQIYTSNTWENGFDCII